MKGIDIRLLLDNTAIAAATNVSIEMTQDVEQYIPIPGSADDDQWAHYRAGNRSWSLSHDGFYTSDYTTLMNAALTGSGQFTANIDLPRWNIIGTVHLTELSIVAQHKALTKCSAKFVCDDFITIE